MSNIYIQEPPTQGKVLLQTSAGELEIELWSKEAPLACRNFVQLCMEGYYDGTIFHRVIPGFIAQGGDPTGTGEGGESIYGGKPFKDEFHSRLRFVRRGLVAMANSKPNDNSSQFFFTLGVCKELDKKHTIFGKVAGDTLYNLPRFEEGEIDKDDRPVYPHKITSTEVLLNPFDDIVPRSAIDNEVPKEERKKKRKKGVKNFSLLSFGGEAEEEEAEVITATKAMGGAGGGHPSLLPADATIPLPERDGARERIREKLKRLTAPDYKTKEKERDKENDQKVPNKDLSKSADSTKENAEAGKTLADDMKKPDREDDRRRSDRGDSRHKRHKDRRESSSSSKRDRSDDDEDDKELESGGKDKKKRRHSRSERKSSQDDNTEAAEGGASRHRSRRDSDRSSKDRDYKDYKSSKDRDRSSKGMDDKDMNKKSNDKDNEGKDKEISVELTGLSSKPAESVEGNKAGTPASTASAKAGIVVPSASAPGAGLPVSTEKKKRRRFEDKPPDVSSVVLPPLPATAPPTATAPTPIVGGEDPDKEKKLAEMRAEIKQLKRELTGRDSSKSKKLTSSADDEDGGAGGREDKAAPEPTLSAVEQYQQEKEKYLKQKRAIPKKGSARENLTLAMFEKFNKKMKLAITVKNGELEDGEEELQEEDSWLHEKVLFDDDTPVLARDASTKDDTWYSLDDPRHPLNKRRRGEGDKAAGGGASSGGKKQRDDRGRAAGGAGRR